MLPRTYSMNDVKYNLISEDHKCGNELESVHSDCCIQETVKERCKLKFIEKLKKNNINFDSEKGNYIDDDFDSVFDAAFESIFNK